MYDEDGEDVDSKAKPKMPTFSSPPPTQISSPPAAPPEIKKENTIKKPSPKGMPIILY